MKKKTKNFFLDKFEEIHENQIINLWCFDEKNLFPDHPCHIEIKAYPPIGSLIRLDKNLPLFKIESLIIDSPTGQNCIANGIFID